MANEITVGELSINLKIKLEGFEKGLETARKKLQSLEEESKKVENSNKNLDASYLAMSATAVLALTKIGSAIKDCVNEYNSYTQAMSSLQNVSEYTGESMSEFSNIMNEFGSYMTQADLATTIKNFSLMGYTAEDTRKMIEALIKSAINGGNSCYTVSEKVRVSSEGFRQGLSTLSDAGGVVENLSIMQNKYAESIGKTASQLTQEEINQAYLNRTMYAAEPFTQSMINYTQTLAFKQGEYSKSLRETQVAYAEALEPTLSGITTIGTEILKITGQFIQEHPTLTAGITSFGTTLAGVTVVLVALSAAKKAYATATGVATLSTKAFTTALLSNPIFIIATALATAIAGINMLCSAIRENEEAQAKLNETTEKYEKIKNNTYEYTDANITEQKTAKESIEKQIKLMEKYIEIEEKINEIKARSKDPSGTSPTGYRYTDEDLKTIEDLKKQLKEAGKNLEEAREKTKDYGHSLPALNERLEETNRFLTEANATQTIKKAMDVDTVKNQQKEAAQLKINAQAMQDYLDIVKQGNKSTSQYQEAEKKLAEAYSECATASGINIEVAQDYINTQQAKAEQDWNDSQQTIKSNIDIINSFIEMTKQAEGNTARQIELANQIGLAYEDIKPTLTSVVNILSSMENAAPATVAGITPKTTSKKSSSSSKSYSNKALDNYKKEIEHKKALDKISLQEEINMYETALRKYAKTQDEKWEIEEKIYSLQKELKDKKVELQENELDNYISNIQHKKALDQISLQQEISMYQTALKNYAKTSEQRKEIRETIYELNKELAQKEKEVLNKQTEDYETYIQIQKNLRGAEYNIKEQTSDYDKIIKMHKNYLNQIMKDERLSLEERKEIYREELATIRSYEQQKRDLRVENINSTVSQLTNAITKQLNEMQEKDKEIIDKNLEEVEKWKDARINAINEEYDARIEAINKELEALDKAEQQKSRDEEDAEYEKKKKRLEDLVAYEHDAVTKANYQKELDKLIAEYQKTLDARALEDKKEALNAQKDLLQEEQDNKIQAIEDESEKQKEVYNKQLEDLEKYYNEQVDMAQETAEKMLLNVEQNQDNILNLLKSYGNAYEITGQNLGEKLAQGINEGLASKIENIIAKIQNSIDAGIENKLSKIASSVYKYEAGKNKPQTKTVNVTQINNIEQNPEMPSETYRKLKNVSQNLAEELAGM